MTVINSVSNTTATTATINMTLPGGDGTIDMQVATRPDFESCVCPIFNVPKSGAVAVGALNQGGRYWVRARFRASSGAVEDWSAPAYPFATAAAGVRNVAPQPVMIEPAKFVVPIPILHFETTETVAGFPATNLFRDSPVAWRGRPNFAGDYAIYVFTAGSPFDTVALLNTNMSEATNIYVTGGYDINSANGPTDFGVSAPGRASRNLPQRPGYHGLIDLGAVRRSQWVRVLVNGDQFPGGIFHAEHLVIGLNRTSKNHAVEKTETPAPMTTIERRRSGAIDRVRGRPMRKVDIELQMLSEAQYETIYGDLWQHENEAVLVVPNSKPGAFLHDRILFGDLTGGRIVNPTSPRYNRSFTINSII